MPNKPKYTLDHLFNRIDAREDVREKVGPYFVMFRIGAEGNWNNTSMEKRKNWNLTESDMEDIRNALESGDIFRSDTVETEESTLAQINDSVERMKKGDCSKFNHLPHFLREYYGRKSLQEFFGTDMDIPPLDDEMKKRLKGMTDRPEFHYAISLLIERNAENNQGTLIGRRLKEYDVYLNERIMKQTLNPVSPEHKMNLKNKFPGEKADTLIEENKEKQVFLANTLFMAQLGRTDVISDNNTAAPYNGSVTELFSHGSRIAYTLPAGDSASQDAIFDELRKRYVDNNTLIDGRFASHDIYRRQVDENGNMEKQFKEIKYKWKDQLSNLELDKKVTTYWGNYGMNIPLGGLGGKFNKTDCIDGQGTFGHCYIKMKKGDNSHCGAILIGIENSAPRTESCIGQKHNFKAIGHDMSTFYASKKTVGGAYGGREVDLSHLKPEELIQAIRGFEAGYRDLQKKAEKDKEALKQLKGINSKLCGKKMTAIELAALMTTLGIEKKDAIKLVEAGRNSKDARYPVNRYRQDMQKIMDPSKVPERSFDIYTTSLMNDLKNMSPYIDNIRRQWKSMASHTLFSAFNSKEFSTMEKAVNNYLKAYDNIMAGKTVDGKEYRPNSTQLSEEENRKLLALEKTMTDAGLKYHNEKVRRKKGGFDKHSSDQARDRDAMSLIIAKFSDEARDLTAVKALQNPEDNTVLNYNQKAELERRKNTAARKQLDEKVKELSDTAARRAKRNSGIKR